MDMQTQELLRNEPGSIGHTARAYATAFKQVAPVEVTDNLHFGLVFRSIISRREKQSDENNLAAGNHLIPVDEKGLREIHRLLSDDKGLKYEQYSLDLPTMVLYSMLLESDLYRKGFAEMNYEDIETVLKIVYTEIKAICPNQVILKEELFVKFNALQVQSFIVKVDSSLSVPVMNKILNGSFDPYDSKKKGVKNNQIPYGSTMNNIHDYIKELPSKATKYDLSTPNSKIKSLIQSGWIKEFIYGFSRSYSNVLKLHSINTAFTTDPTNIFHLYESSISYYNSGFGKESGLINQSTKIIEDYILLMNLMFSDEFGKEKTAVSVTGIKENDVLVDYSLFSFYILLSNFLNIRLALWEAFQTSDLEIKELYEVVYSTAKCELNLSKIKNQILPFDSWKRMASNIVWNIKQKYAWYETDGEFRLQ